MDKMTKSITQPFFKILDYGIESEDYCRTYPELRNAGPPDDKMVQLCKKWITENCEKRDTYYSKRDYTHKIIDSSIHTTLNMWSNQTIIHIS